VSDLGPAIDTWLSPKDDEAVVDAEGYWVASRGCLAGSAGLFEHAHLESQSLQGPATSNARLCPLSAVPAAFMSIAEDVPAAVMPSGSAGKVGDEASAVSRRESAAVPRPFLPFVVARFRIYKTTRRHVCYAVSKCLPRVLQSGVEF
jgi:hypothetical protein